MPAALSVLCCSMSSIPAGAKDWFIAILERESMDLVDAYVNGTVFDDQVRLSFVKELPAQILFRLKKGTSTDQPAPPPPTPPAP